MKTSTNHNSHLSAVVLVLAAVTGGLILQFPSSASNWGLPGSASSETVSAPHARPQGFMSSDTLAAPDRGALARIRDAYGKLPISFEANAGQADCDVKFISRGNSSDLDLTSKGAVLRLWNADSISRCIERAIPQRGSNRERRLHYSSDKTSHSLVRMMLVGGKSEPTIEGIDELPGKVNYLIGNDPKRWQTNIPTYSSVRYRDVYPGVDLIFHGGHQQLEYDFIVAPGASTQAIRVAFEGAREIHLNAQGDLVLETAAGYVHQRRPVIYQWGDGIKQQVAGRYVIRGEREIAFEVAEYDRNSQLVIDPVLSYSTYLGGGGMEQAAAIAVDSAGCAYVTGFTTSPNFPTASPLQHSFGGAPNDAFVAKLNAAGDGLVYSTFFGGSGNDDGVGIAVDSSGNVYVTGFTASPDFPVANPYQLSAGGGSGDAFVARLNESGSALVYSTYLGGGGQDIGFGVAVDQTGNAYVTGETESNNFPTVTPLQATYGGAVDAFVTKLSGAGQISYSTYLGGIATDRGRGIALDPVADVYVTGVTDSVDFSVTTGAYQTAIGRGFDAFVTKINGDGSALVYSTYLGGRNNDGATAIAVDLLGSAYVTGGTLGKFPATPGAFQPGFGGGNARGGDGFAAKFDRTGAALIYSTYLGGSSSDQGNSIAVDRFGNAYIAGDTSSLNFPTQDAFGSSFGGGFMDGFAAKINSKGSSLIYSSCVGGNDFDSSVSIAVDARGSAYVAGFTSSANFPLVNPLQGHLGSAISDAFICKIAGAYEDDGAAPTLTSLQLLRNDEPVSYLIAGSKAKRYRLILTGAGFVADTQVLVDAAEVKVISISSTETYTKLPSGRIGGAGTVLVQARNPDGQVSNSLIVEIRDE